mgnify:FL=1
MLYNINSLYLHRVFHGIRFKVNNEDWLSVTDSLFLYMIFYNISVVLPLDYNNMDLQDNRRTVVI